jgi:hypothetical protein
VSILGEPKEGGVLQRQHQTRFSKSLSLDGSTGGISGFESVTQAAKTRLFDSETSFGWQGLDARTLSSQ